LNGVELGGGSIRIHDLNLQKQVFGEILKLSDERLASFSHLLESLQYGFPPHGGMALGLDRIMTFICSSTKEDDGVSTRPEPLSIRDVIAFPKSSRGKDLMIGSPAGISLEQAECYHQQ
jgi:aspartyl-tRNA synthetase